MKRCPWAALALAALAACHESLPPGKTSPEAAAPPTTANPAGNGVANPTGEPTPGAPGVPQPTPAPFAAPQPRPSGKIKIIVRSIPPKAYVRWGKKTLGQTPYTIERPRDSGPVDLIVRADGYIPLHTRAYSFRNDIFTVRLTKLADRMTVFGARAELPPEPSPAPALAPPPPSE